MIEPTADPTPPVQEPAAPLRRDPEAFVLLALAAGLPLSVNPFGTLGFEPFKVALLRLAGLALAGIWLGRLWHGRPALGGRRPHRPIVLSALALLGANLVATICSIDPRTSLLGSYDRLEGLLTLAALLAIGLAAATSRVGPVRLTTALLVGSAPVTIYALLQAARLDPFTWLDRTFGPASTLGSSTALGSYLAMLVPLSIARAAVERRPLTRAALLALGGLQAAGVVVSGVRGALMGLGTGLVVLALLALIRGQANRRAGLLIGLVALGLGLPLAASPAGLDLVGLRDLVPVLARLSTIGPRDVSGRERLLIWRAAGETLVGSGPRILVGFGPETQALALEARFPVELANRLGDARFDRAHNWALDHLLTTGLLGLAAVEVLLVVTLLAGWRAVAGGGPLWLPAGLLAGLVAHLIESSLAFDWVGSSLLFWLTVGLLAGWGAAAGKSQADAGPPGARVRTSCLIGGLVLIGLLPVVASPVVADLAYTRALAFHGGKDGPGEVAWLLRAARLAPDRELYPLALGVALGDQAGKERSPARRTELLRQAERAIRRAAALSPNDPYTWFHLGHVLEIRSDAEGLAEPRSAAVEAYARAASLSPRRALFPDAAALALLRAGRPADALVWVQGALALRGESADRLALVGNCQTALGQFAEAEATYRDALLGSPRSSAALAGLAELRRQQGDLAAALQAARLASRYQSRDWRYREQLATLEASAGHLGAAVAEARAAARFAPPWETARLRELVARLKAGG